MAEYTDTTCFRVNSIKREQNFSDNITVANHVEIKIGNMSHVCILCGNSFSSKYDLKTHMKTHSISGENTYQCSKCDKVFKYTYKLEKHMNTHTSDLPYKCTHCGDSFKHEFRLTHHMTVHTGEKPYHCNLCGSGFNRLSLFRKHLQTHTEKTSYICSLCDKTFLNESKFKNHMKTHIEKTSYICSLCDKTFLSESKFKEHMDVAHSTYREKPYQCSHCDKAFIKEQSLKRHIVIHIAESPYQCSLCDKGFVVKGMYLKHMEIHRVQRLDKNCKFSKILPEEIVESHLQTDAEQETYQCSYGETVEEVCSIRTEPSLSNAQPVDCNIVDIKTDNSVTSRTNTETSTRDVKPGCQSPYLNIIPKAAKKKKINIQSIKRNNVNMNVDNCATFSQAYALACLTEKGESTSFQRIMKQYSVANNLPVVIHPRPDKEILEFYSRKLVFNK